MALFGTKKDNKKKEVSKNDSVNEAGGPRGGLKSMSPAINKRSVENVILHPRITEKATDVAEDTNAYVFDVDPSATKKEIVQAVQKLYKVSPVKVRTSKVAKKPTTIKGKKVLKSGGKKAYVYLKEGDSIEFV